MGDNVKDACEVWHERGAAEAIAELQAIVDARKHSVPWSSASHLPMPLGLAQQLLRHVARLDGEVARATQVLQAVAEGDVHAHQFARDVLRELAKPTP